ncbi:thioredoxin [Fodinicurvata fenggangensis]|uniref:thioredoxin n=1 Tax=Fodinicurvata fenggangensis TaxID=1121830 RepID=UPI000558FD81|nr:thioredoxin [Fodinicurvata fenggangensis]
MEPLIGLSSSGNGSQEQAGAAGDLIKESNLQSFRADVIDASMQQPVLVDFWAEWCGPCKQLGPALEKVVKEARGTVKLVKIDVDQNQELAQQLRIQSLPTVYAFYQGQPIDGFQGALPESQLKEFITRVTEAAGVSAPGATTEELLQQAEAQRKDGQAEEAMQTYISILEQESENAAALAGLLRCRIDLGDTEEVEQALEDLNEPLRSSPEIQAVHSALELAREAAESGDAAELEARLQANPDDHQARFDLAQAHFAQGRKEAAAEALLEIIRRKKDWNEDAARQQLVKYFEAWGPSDPVTQDARRRLSSLLFA